MDLLDKLKNNRGTVSSALSKELAKKVLAGDHVLLQTALPLLHYQDKSVRSGAAKIIEKVAEEQPSLVADKLRELLPCMQYPEPQTRWMVVHIMGLCAAINPKEALSIWEDAITYLDQQYGTVLNDRAITYLGYVGALSEVHAKKAFPHLMAAFKKVPKRHSRILESFSRMVNLLDTHDIKTLLHQLQVLASSDKPSITKWVKKLRKQIDALST